MKIGFMASHGGSAAQYLIGAANSGALAADIGPLITNNPKSEISRWCSTNGVDVHYISARSHPDEAMRDAAMLEVFTSSGTELVVLSGYMKKIGTQMLTHYRHKILNIHPSLLPKFGGKGMYGDQVYEAVLAAQETTTGASVQSINEEYDQGPVLAQAIVPIAVGETVATLKKKVQALEGGLYLKVIRELASNAS
jgi:phosphoribosylglycinamide formyltransferase 1